MEQIAEAIIEMKEQLSFNNLCQGLHMLAITLCLVAIGIRTGRK